MGISSPQAGNLFRNFSTSYKGLRKQLFRILYRGTKQDIHQTSYHWQEAEAMTAYEKRNLFNRYKREPLFRQWLPTLGVLSRAGQGNEIEIWHETKLGLRRLKHETEWRDAEIQFFYTDLCERYPSTPIFCLAVMATLFTCLIDEAPCTGHSGENPYASACMTISTILGNDRRFRMLLKDFFSHARNDWGKQIAHPAMDYLYKTDNEKEPETNPPVTDGSTDALKQLVENALEEDDIPHLRALELRLYKLDNPELTRPLITRINERIAVLTNLPPVTLNIFHEGANQINQSTLQDPIFEAGESDKNLTENNHE